MTLPCFWICWSKKQVKENYQAILSKASVKEKQRQKALKEENQRLLQDNKLLRQKIEETHQPPGYYQSNPAHAPSAPTISPKRQVMEGEEGEGLGK
jgi:hypothetical protein